jgi:hypothetical protein
MTQKIDEIYVDGQEDEILVIKKADSLLESMPRNLRMVVIIILEDKITLRIPKEKK